MFKVRKKNGSIEDFDRNHIVSSVMKAGGTAEEAEKVASTIDAWLPTVAVDGIVNSTDIRVKGLEVMQVVNPQLAATFGQYQKPVSPNL